MRHENRAVMELLRPTEIKRMRNDYGISALEIAAVCGLQADLVRQIEDHQVVALDTDLERIGAALKEIIQQRCRNKGKE